MVNFMIKNGAFSLFLQKCTPASFEAGAWRLNSIFSASDAVDVSLHFLLGAYRPRAFNKALALVVGHFGKNSHSAHVARKRRGKPERNVSEDRFLLFFFRRFLIFTHLLLPRYFRYIYCLRFCAGYA